jgi:CheY-like chemotaxis protein/HPt (histidine-containing phosphotransfer) domain-containing protein
VDDIDNEFNEDILRMDTKKLDAVKILVVEDDLTSAKMMKLLLEKKGLLVDLSYNGEEAIELYKINKYDLILMDVNLPVMDGFEATKLIRELEYKKTSKIPIIAMTAKVLEGDKEKCIFAGMNDYLKKPIEIENALHVLAKYLRKDDNFTSIVTERNDISKMDNFEKDLNRLMNSTGFDELTSLELIGDFLSYASKLVDNLEKCLSNELYSEVKGILHQIKGTSGNLRLSEIYELAQKGEGLILKNDKFATEKVAHDIHKQLKYISDELEKKNYKYL